MADAQWGHCKGCRFFADSDNENAQTHQCVQPELAEFELEVSGDSGCNAFEARAGMAKEGYQEPAPSVH